MTFVSSLKKFQSSLKNLSSDDLKEDASSITDFEGKKSAYKASLFFQAKNDLIKASTTLGSENKKVFERMVPLLDELKDLTDVKKANDIVQSLSELSKGIVQEEPSQTASSLSFSVKNVPSEISDEVRADVNELEKCFKEGCFRASVILCGRLLEIALHRLYYEKTQRDILEKNPGIGLGTLVAKLKEKNVELDPALTQQIHLINQVRIFSVHRKKQSFHPTKEQTQAIILYTMDIVKKLF